MDASQLNTIVLYPDVAPQTLGRLTP